MPNLTLMLDYVAALRELMDLNIPDPVTVSQMAELAGVDGVAAYLREDRRHIQERDVRLLRQTVQSRLILHMAATSEMMGIALDVKPERVVLMPEIRSETSDLSPGSLDLVVQGKELFETIDTLQSNNISVGVCIAARPEQAKIAHQLRADWVQIHAGSLITARSAAKQRQAWDGIVDTVKMAHKLRLQIAVGHGLDERLIKLFKGIGEIDEFSLGRSILAKAWLWVSRRTCSRWLG
ncbi:MAG: pyridoxine 5'-phosphate synthase [Desulfosarcinaceae bacterium]